MDYTDDKFTNFFFFFFFRFSNIGQIQDDYLQKAVQNINCISSLFYFFLVQFISMFQLTRYFSLTIFLNLLKEVRTVTSYKKLLTVWYCENRLGDA